jgi:predicted  nucleic acid-binding Zn-ribbon protein
MSFLKQLLNPFIEFDADKNQTPQNTTAAQPPGKPPQKTTATHLPGKPPTQPSPKPSPVAKAPAPPQSPPKTPPLPPKAPAPQPKPPAPAPPPFIDASHHPMIDAPGAAVSQQVPTFSSSGAMLEPLQEHVLYFEKLIDEANRTNPLFKGTDYKEFVDSKIDIDDISDEALKYQTAYNVLKSSGLSREKLLATGQEYINLIGRDLNSFKGAFSIKYRKEVGHEEQQIQKKVEELQALVQQMNALKAEINQLTQGINLTREKLNTNRSSFLLAGENKQHEIETELQKIAQYF